MININANIVGGKRQNIIPFKDDLNLDAKGRLGLVMSDTVGSNDIDISTATYRGANNIFRKFAGGELERIFDGNSYTVYFKFNALEALAAASSQILQMGNNLGFRRGISIYGVGGALQCGLSDGTKRAFPTIVADYDTTLLPLDWLEVFIEMDKPLNQLRCTIYNQSTGAIVGTPSNTDVSTWSFTSDDNYSAMHLFSNICAYADLKKFSGLKTLEQCQDNTYQTNLQFHLPTIYDGTDVSTNAYHCIESGSEPTIANWYYSDISTYCLDYGYTLYRSPKKQDNLANSLYFDRYAPNKIDGTPIARVYKDPAVNTYDKIKEYSGSLAEHNLADSRLNIPVSSWDKSSATIFEDAVRTSLWYDASNVDEWHVSELDYLQFSFNSKTGHDGLNFFKITDNSMANRNILKEIFSYTTNKTGSELDKVLKYTGDYQAMNNAIQLYNDASVLQNIDFKLGGFTGEDSFMIYLGDGTIQESFTMDGTLQTVTKNYGGTENYKIHIFNAPNIQKIKLDNISTIELAPLNADINEFRKSPLLEMLDLYINSTTWTGTIDNLSKALKVLKIDRTMFTVISGDITPFVVLEWFEMYASTHGDLSNALDITNIWFDGAMTCTVDVTNLTKAEWLASYADDSLGYGSVENKPNLVHICWGTPNQFTGDISGYQDFEYMDNWGTVEVHSSITADVSTLPKLWCLRSRDCENNFTGSLAANTILELFKVYDDSSTLTKLTTIANKPLLCQFRVDQVFSSAEVNQIMADVVTNKDAAKRFPTNRYIHTAFGASGAPTGQGIIDKAAMEIYSSPTPPGTADTWTIDTN